MRYEWTKRAPWKLIALSIVAAIVATVFFSALLPIEGALFLGVTAGVPALITFEAWWTSRYEALPWTPIRFAVIVAVAVGGTFLETDYIDQPIPASLSGSSLPLGTLATELEAQGIHVERHPGDANLTVHFPSRRPRVRELIAAVESQTHLHHRLTMCDTLPSLWSRPYPIRPVGFYIEVRE